CHLTRIKLEPPSRDGELRKRLQSHYFCSVHCRNGSKAPSPLAGPSTFLGRYVSPRNNRAGFPATNTPDGTSRVTTDPAATTLSRPIVTPGITITPPPIHTLSSIIMGRPPSHPALRGSASKGCVGVSNCTFGPIRTSSPIVIAATSKATSP